MQKYIQGSKEWKELRRKHIGSSDAAVILQVSPWKTPYHLWQEKLGLIEEPEANWYMTRGLELEKEARKWAEDYLEEKFEPAVVFHAEHKFMIASLDGINASKKTVLEIKCPGPADHELAKNGKIPPKYYPQLMHQLACTGLDALFYISYVSDTDVRLLVVDRDDKFIKEMIELEEDFYQCMINLESPALMDRDFKERKDVEWIQAVTAYKKAKTDLQEVEEAEKVWREKLISLAGGLSSMGSGLKLSKVTSRGRVDYSKIAELKMLNLDSYRKPATESWRITIK